MKGILTSFDTVGFSGNKPRAVFAKLSGVRPPKVLESDIELPQHITTPSPNIGREVKSTRRKCSIGVLARFERKFVRMEFPRRTCICGSRKARHENHENARPKDDRLAGKNQHGEVWDMVIYEWIILRMPFPLKDILLTDLSGWLVPLSSKTCCQSIAWVNSTSYSAPSRVSQYSQPSRVEGTLMRLALGYIRDQR